MNNAELVKYLYERFAQGDTAAILAKFDPTVEFRLAKGHPYQPGGEPWRGERP